MTKQLTDLTALVEVPAPDDLLWVRDISDTTDAASGTDKKVTRQNLLGNWDLNINIAAPNATVPVLLLSAAGVAETNCDVALTPKGTGALLAHIPDGTAIGGNKRGAYAVDLQLNRLFSPEVASGGVSTILGGERNTASGQWSAVVGGYNNQASGLRAFVGCGNANEASGDSSVVVGGGSGSGADGNKAEGNQSFVGGGSENRITNNGSTITGGTKNFSDAIYTSICGGYQNQTRGAYAASTGGRENSANGSYAFVGGGQYNKANGLYSAVAGGKQNDALGEHCAVLGGHYNVVAANCARSAIVAGGGSGGEGNNIAQSAGALIAAGNSNSIGATSVSDRSAIVGGSLNTLDGQAAFLGSGAGNSVSVNQGVLVGGAFNGVSGYCGFVGAGVNNTAEGKSSAVVSGENGKALIAGQQAHAMGNFSNDGDAQRSHVMAKVATTDGTVAELEVDGAAGSIAIPNNTTWEAQIRIVARQQGGTRAASFWRRALISKDGTAGSTALVAESTPDADLTSASTPWSVALSADTTNGALKIDVTGEAATNIRWVAHISLVEVGYA